MFQVSSTLKKHCQKAIIVYAGQPRPELLGGAIFTNLPNKGYVESVTSMF